jgi:hypothetical protein
MLAMKPLAWLWLVLVLALPPPSWAKQAPVELAMVVTGTVTLNPDGSVKAYAIDHADQLPAGVQHLLKSTVPGWTFDSIKAAGKMLPANTRMSVRITGTVTATTKQKVGGKKVEQNTVQIGVADITLHCPPPHAEFSPEAGCDPNASLRFWPEDKPPTLPQYPLAAVKLQAGGAVHLYLDVDSAGHIMRAAVGRVDLYMQVPRPERLRKLLGDAALQATQDWQFSVPTAGPHALAGHWVVEQTLKFVIAGDHAANVGDGQWLAYQPGPDLAIPWASADAAAVIRLPDVLVPVSLLPDPHAPPLH